MPLVRFMASTLFLEKLFVHRNARAEFPAFIRTGWQSGRFWTAAGSEAQRRFRTREKLPDEAACPCVRKRCRRYALPAHSKIAGRVLSHFGDKFRFGGGAAVAGARLSQPQHTRIANRHGR